MAKEKYAPSGKDYKNPEESKDIEEFSQDQKLPKEIQEKLKQIKEKLDKFSKSLVEKFGKYIAGVSLLPPPKPEKGKEIPKDQINILVLVDDSDVQKMTKEELHDKLVEITNKLAGEIDKNIVPQVIVLSELWQFCYDAKYDYLQTIAMSAPIYDTGMLNAIKIAEIHKTMVLKKFEKYIVTYVLAGSLVQGKATKDSDIDVFIVIDDTDVKKLTRAELKDRLRGIIIGMGMEAGEFTGIKNKINIQVYILTDFWESIKEANPIIFTFLRDGVPFYDRGIFMPWKLLLKMGRIKPSGEAIEMYMSSGEQLLKRIEFKLNDIGMEDLFYAILTPSQAALMLYGIPPPTPRETPKLMQEIFVEKEKILEESFIKTLEKIIGLRKDIEHGTRKTVSGKEIDELLDASSKYLDRLKKLFAEIEKRKEDESIVHIYETLLSILRDILRIEGIERVKDSEAINLFETALVATGKIPERFLRLMKDIFKAKKDYDTKNLTKTEVEKTRKEAGELIKFLIEYSQRKRGRELERARIRIKHGSKFGEIVLLEKEAFIVHDIDAEQKEVTKAKLLPDGSLKQLEKSSIEELDKSLLKVEMLPRVFIKEKTFEELRAIFGKNVEVLINY